VIIWLYSTKELLSVKPILIVSDKSCAMEEKSFFSIVVRISSQKCIACSLFAEMSNVNSSPPQRASLTCCEQRGNNSSKIFAKVLIT